MRRRRSASFASGARNENGRIAVPWLVPSAATAVCADSKPAAPAAAEAARTWRRVGVDEFSDMMILHEAGEGWLLLQCGGRCPKLWQRPIGPLRLPTTDLGMVVPRSRLKWVPTRSRRRAASLYRRYRWR